MIKLIGRTTLLSLVITTLISIVGVASVLMGTDWHLVAGTNTSGSRNNLALPNLQRDSMEIVPDAPIQDPEEITPDAPIQNPDSSTPASDPTGKIIPDEEVLLAPTQEEIRSVRHDLCLTIVCWIAATPILCLTLATVTWLLTGDFSVILAHKKTFTLGDLLRRPLVQSPQSEVSRIVKDASQSERGLHG